MISAKAQKAIYLLTIIFSILFLAIGNRFAARDMVVFDAENAGAVTAKIVEIVSKRVSEADPNAEVPEETLHIVFKARIETGPAKGAVVTGLQTADSFTPAEIRHARQGDRILLYEIQEVPEESVDRWVLQEFIRTGTLYRLALLFLAALLLFGRAKGFSTIVSLAFTCAAVFLIFVPSVLAGHNMYLSSLVVCLFVIAMTLLLVNGADMKSLAAGLGCVGGVAVSGLLVLAANLSLQLTGLVDEQSVYLLYLNPDAPIDLKGVIFSSIVIGGMGATLDVSVSISAALSEVRHAMHRPTRAALFKSGMTIGRDIMGTMANTLVLAYIGSSLSLVLLLLVHAGSLTDLMNREIIVVEMLRALAGSIGLLCTIPLTSLLAAYVYTLRPTHGDRQ